MMRGPILGGRTRLKFSNALNIVVDGNSLVFGQGGAQNIPRVLAKTAPISTVSAVGFLPDATQLPSGTWQSDKGVTVTNLGVNGQTWRQMNGFDGQPSSDVDGAWVSGKTNVLIAWEGTNSIANIGVAPAQAVQDATDYITARQAKNRWIVLIGTCLPRQKLDQATTTKLNADLDTYNSLLRANYRKMGARGLFDVRQAGSAFNLSDYLMQTFEDAANAAGSYWALGETGGHIHLNSNGYNYVVNTFIMPALQRLPAR